MEKTASAGLEGVYEETESNISVRDIADESSKARVRRLSCFEEIVPSALADFDCEPTLLATSQVEVGDLSRRDTAQAELERATSPEDTKISEDDDQ